MINNEENIYLGDEVTVKCKTSFYDLLMSGKEVTPSMILAHIMHEDLDTYDGLNLDEDLPQAVKKYRVKQKQIMKPMVDLLKRHVGNNEIEKKSIGGHHYAYIYHAADKDPLRYMRLTAIEKNLDDYFQFCQDSAGFFPMSWMEHFFKNTKDLGKYKESIENGNSCIKVSVDREHKNIELLPCIYECIREKCVIEFDYCHHYEKDKTHRVIHPQFLHEYNGRWHLLGYEEGKDKPYPANVALDRITSDVRKLGSRSYIPAKSGFYDEYFKNMIGVTHGIPPTPQDWHESRPHRVLLRAYSLYIYKLIESKPIHHSQKSIGQFNENCNYGDFEMYIELNNEFIGRVLQMGDGLELLEPESYRNEIARRVGILAKKYNIIE